MSILKPKPKQEKAQIRITVDTQILSDIQKYCEYAGFNKPDDFIEEAALHILTKDKDFKEWKETRTQSTQA